MWHAVLLIGIVVGCARREPRNYAEARAADLAMFQLAAVPMSPAGGDSLILRLEVHQAFDTTAIVTIERSLGRWTAIGLLRIRPDQRPRRTAVRIHEASLPILAPLVSLDRLTLRPNRSDSIMSSDGCWIMVEQRDHRGYRLWLYDNPSTYRTPADSLMIGIIERAFRVAGLSASCGS